MGAGCGRVKEDVTNPDTLSERGFALCNKSPETFPMLVHPNGQIREARKQYNFQIGIKSMERTG